MSSFIGNRRYEFSLYSDGQLIDRRNGRTLKDECNGTRRWLYAKSSVPIIDGRYVLRNIWIDYVDLEHGKIEFTAMVKRLKEEIQND
jgi:hypothetical protein